MNNAPKNIQTSPINPASQLFPIAQDMEEDIAQCDDVFSFYQTFKNALEALFTAERLALLVKNEEGAFILHRDEAGHSLEKQDDFIDFSQGFVVQRFDETRKMTVVSLDGKVIHLIPVHENSTLIGIIWLESVNRIPASVEMIVFHMVNIYKNKLRPIAIAPEPENKGILEMLVEKLSRLFGRR